MRASLTTRQSLLLTALLCVSPLLSGQAQQASAISASRLQASLTALTSGTAIQDIRADGTFQSFQGSRRTSGNAVLKATASGSSRVDLDGSSGTISEIRTVSGSQPVGEWIGSDGAQHSMKQHNLLNEPAWFSPTIVLQRILSNPDYVVTDLGTVTRRGVSCERLRAALHIPALSGKSAQDLQRLTQIDVYVSVAANLPVVISFNQHPDSDSTVDFPVEIHFSKYQSVQGVLVPFSITKYLNSNLVLSLQLQEVEVNSGLPSTTFSWQ